MGVASVIPCAGRATAPATSSPAFAGWAAAECARLPQRDVHRPVVTTEFGELAGAVERVDDPHPLGGQPDGVVGTLLGQHRVTRTLGGQRLHQEVVGALVPRRFSLILTGLGELAAHIEQQLAGLGRQPRGDVVIAHCRLSSSSMTRSASSSGEQSGVSRRSGFFGRWYGLSIPVKWVISPARALAYKPFGSRRSQSSSGVSQNTSKKSSPASWSPAAPARGAPPAG